MVCGTCSDAGKSSLVAGLLRALARRGVAAAPFKAQNMALNSYVTSSGHEIGRAQGVQAIAAGTEPTVEMNPILLKPTGEQTSQVVVMGRPIGHFTASEYHQMKDELFGVVRQCLATLRERFDVVVLEGAGSPAEVNLADRDIVNLRLAETERIPAILVGDIDRGGVFASLVGTLELLPPGQRRLVRGFVVNKLRGDPRLLGNAAADLEQRTGVPTLGVIPWTPGLELDAEDSLAIDANRPQTRPARGDWLDVCVVRLPRISNFTDLDPLWYEPGVAVRWVVAPSQLRGADLIVIPGSKATVHDLAWVRSTGLDRAIGEARDDEGGPMILGICGGYQMLSRTIRDDVESAIGVVEGLGLLDVEVSFSRDKIVRRRKGTCMGAPVEGYEIHHGIPTRGAGCHWWVQLSDEHGSELEGAFDLRDARVVGTSLHGLFESDTFRENFLCEVARRRERDFVPAGLRFAALRERRLDLLADLVEEHVGVDVLLEIANSSVDDRTGAAP